MSSEFPVWLLPTPILMEIRQVQIEEMSANVQSSGSSPAKISELHDTDK
jgi:hypothetical protein